MASRTNTLARFAVEVIDGLDLSAMVKSYRGTGSARPIIPALLLGLLVYGYATGVNWRGGAKARSKKAI